MILNGSMTQGWMAPSLPLTSLGDALIFEDFCVSSCPGAEWSKQWVLGTLLGSCSPFACYILLWFYEIALPLSYLSTRSSLLVDFSGFFKFRMCSSFTLYRLFTFVSPPPTFPKPSSWGPTVECTNSPGHAWIERDGPNKAPWCGTPLGGSSYLAICCCFFEYGCWMFEYVWYCMFGGFLNTFGFFGRCFFFLLNSWMDVDFERGFLLSFPPELLV